MAVSMMIDDAELGKFLLGIGFTEPELSQLALEGVKVSCSMVGCVFHKGGDTLAKLPTSMKNVKAIAEGADVKMSPFFQLAVASAKEVLGLDPALFHAGAEGPGEAVVGVGGAAAGAEEAESVFHEALKGAGFEQTVVFPPVVKWEPPENAPVALSEASALYQKVKGTSSVYRVVAVGERVCVAARLTPGNTLSMRIEAREGCEELLNKVSSVGFGKKSGYASFHVQGGNELAVVQTVAGVVGLVAYEIDPTLCFEGNMMPRLKKACAC